MKQPRSQILEMCKEGLDLLPRVSDFKHMTVILLVALARLCGLHEPAIRQPGKVNLLSTTLHSSTVCLSQPAFRRRSTAGKDIFLFYASSLLLAMHIPWYV